MSAEEPFDTQAAKPSDTLQADPGNGGITPPDFIAALRGNQGFTVAVDVPRPTFERFQAEAGAVIGGPDTVNIGTVTRLGAGYSLQIGGQAIVGGAADTATIREQLSAPGTIWPNPEGGLTLYVQAAPTASEQATSGHIGGGSVWAYNFSFCDPTPEEREAIRAALLERNARLGAHNPHHGLLELPSAAKEQVTQVTLPKPGRPRSAPTKPLPGTLKFAGNAPNTAAVCAMANARSWEQGGESERFRRFWRQEMRAATVTVGIPHSDRAEQIWEYLSKGGAAMVKAHYALWARWYEDADQSGRVRLSINQFCEDLGYKRHHKGGYKLERKQDAMRILEAMTSTEIVAVCRMKGIDRATGKTRVCRLRGRLWERGLTAESMDEYSDLLGTAREGDPSMWEPEGFSYRPGDWFDDSEWRKQNRAVGKIASGILKLRVDTDEWAILIGGYLATMCRANGYRPVRLRASTILERSGTAPISADGKRRAGRYEEKFTAAMDKLQEHGVIGGWQWAGGPVEELTDPDDPDAIAAYYADDTRSHDWRSQVVEITWPASMAADAERLEAATAKQITAAKRRGTAKRRTKQAGPAAQDVPLEGG